ncbi:MAG TPA: PEP-CTERM sorting domain-containing protein [Bryobacteraceae bacterium]|nr:PEP-CTERM sorting domain-containing protein [Bryobacteraceae bacterium]
MRIRAVCRLALILSLTGFSLHATTLTLGDPPMLGTGNCIPFGCPGFVGLTTYQQVYLSSAFPGTISISGLTFFDDQVFNGGLPAGGSYSVSFSYTAFDPGELSLTSPAANISSGSQSFFSGTLPSLTPAGTGSELIITGTPFTYDPADGNLLITVTITGGTGTSPFLFLDEAQCGPQTACPGGTPVISGNAYFGTSPGGNYQGGLVTGFSYTSLLSTPEPASVLLVLTGLGLVGYQWRRRRALKG